jgi:hypothetical protein
LFEYISLDILAKPNQRKAKLIVVYFGYVIITKKIRIRGRKGKLSLVGFDIITAVQTKPHALKLFYSVCRSNKCPKTQNYCGIFPIKATFSYY